MREGETKAGGGGRERQRQRETERERHTQRERTVVGRTYEARLIANHGPNDRQPPLQVIAREATVHQSVPHYTQQSSVKCPPPVP